MLTCPNLIHAAPARVAAPTPPAPIPPAPTKAAAPAATVPAPLSRAARAMLRHYAGGEMFNWLNEHDGAVGWMKPKHRGIQRLDRVHVGDRVKRYMNSPRFEVRYNQCFDEVVRCCADPERQGKTWITAELAAGYGELHRHGYAYSCEAWEAGALVGGLFGVQIGAFVTADSMFHRVNNASKVAYGRNLLHLRDRGFSFVDVNYAGETNLRFGAEWVPQWQFESMARPLLRQRLPLLEGQTPPALPWHFFAGLSAARVAGAIARRLKPAPRGGVVPAAPPLAT